jgi:DNA repair photolyase
MAGTQMKPKHFSRGALTNPSNRFFQHEHEPLDEYLEWCRIEGEEPESDLTQLIPVHPKSIVNKVTSVDVGFEYSINPYQGCEHGCIYCYARNTHEYWGYSMGQDFERKVLYKAQGADLLRAAFNKKSWVPKMIMLSGNTDCYQPAERKLKLTRELLEVCLEYKHPVGIITKNALLLRDLDLLEALNELNLLRVTLSITTLDEALRRNLEPRTSTAKQRLKALEILSEKGIPVNVNLAPIIPGLNSHEIVAILNAAGERGARSAAYIMVRLNGQISDLFEDWIAEIYPDRAAKVLNQIRETHGGTLNDSEWNRRMKGEGPIAEQIKNMFDLAKKKYLVKSKPPPISTDLFFRPGEQYKLLV